MARQQTAAGKIGVRDETALKDMISQRGVNLPMNGLVLLAFEEEIERQTGPVRHERLHAQR